MREKRGITLIALLITIIVLLILAGVSIGMLTGDNGILTKAQVAAEKTNEAKAKEKVQVAVMGSYGEDGKLNYSELKTNLDKVEGIIKSTIPETITEESFDLKVTVDGYNIIIKKNGEVLLEGISAGDSGNENKPTLPSTEDTTPYLPEGATIDKEHSTLDNGLVIKDENNNEWVWIEVPKSIYTNASYNGGAAPTSSEDYVKIESIMQSYASAYRESSYADTFYSTEQHGFANSTEYDNWKNSMLKSVYENGGFYIGRYEVGTDTARFAKSDDLTTPLIQIDKYPYSFVTCRQAQSLAKQLTTGGKQASLMFGIQWDLVMKYIEEKGGKTQAELKSDSSSWGNYKNVTFVVNRGEYITEATTNGLWKLVNNYTKPSLAILLTTGATDRNIVLGIYDLAGNVLEWTLERNITTDASCANRGGSCYDVSDYPAASHYFYNTSISGLGVGFRPVLW